MSFYSGTNAAAPPAAASPFGAQPTARPPMPAPPGMPMQGSPYGAYQVPPQQLWAQLGYMIEPTMIEVNRDLIKDSNDSARFAVGGGMLAMAQIISHLIDFRLTHFFGNYRIELHQVPGGEGAMFLKPAAEQPTEEGRRLHTLTDNDLTARIEEIKNAINANLLADADARIDLHARAAASAAQQGVMGSLLEEAAGTGKGGVLGAVGSMVGSGLRTAAGLPPAPKPPGV